MRIAQRVARISASEGAPSRRGLMTDAGIDAIQTTLEGRRMRRRMRAARPTRRFHAPVWQLLTTISSFCPGFRVRITLLTLNRFRRARLSRFPKILRPHPVAAPMDTKQSTRRTAREKSMQPTHEQCAAASPISDVPPPRWLGLRPGQRSTENTENEHNSLHCCTASLVCVCQYYWTTGHHHNHTTRT